MNRNVFAILISVPQSDRFGGDEIPRATEAMERFCKLLTTRFKNPKPKILPFPRPLALKDDVQKAFKQVGKLASSGDLFVVMFIGHGIPSDHGKHAYEAWALNDAEFSDRDLANRLAELDPDVEVVVISDACYGAGIARPGSKGLSRVWSPFHELFSEVFDEACERFYTWPFLARYREMKLKAFADAWTPHALPSRATKPTELPTLNQMVCISAASWDDEVSLSNMSCLIDMTIKAVECNETHGALADRFYIQSATDAAFQLQAFPNNRMCKPLLPQQAVAKPQEQRNSMTNSSADLAPKTHIAFVNYDGKFAHQVDYIPNNETLAVTAIPKKDDPAKGYTQSDPDPETKAITLTIQPEVVVGFVVQNAITINIKPGSCISVITWKGKDPPVPPPPPRLARYSETLTFDTEFRALLGAGGVGTKLKADTTNGDSMRPSSPSSPQSYPVDSVADPDQPRDR
jgi:hypothetical protein